jgi:phosphoserine phosphatase
MSRSWTRGWAGTAEAQVREWLAELPLVDGIADVIRWCRDHDVVPALATLAWRPVGSYLCETFGFHDCSGPALEVRDGIFTGAALDSCDEYGKRDFAKRVAALTAPPTPPAHQPQTSPLPFPDRKPFYPALRAKCAVSIVLTAAPFTTARR